MRRKIYGFTAALWIPDQRKNNALYGDETHKWRGGIKNHMTDSQLIFEIKQGNVDLYSELMRRYQRKILAFVYHMLKSSNLELIAEDLCSETFYKAFRSLHSFREVDASFSTWLYTIARNTVLSELRKQRRGTLPLEESGVVPIAPLEIAPEQAILRSERVALVREAINNLPEKQRSALILREYDQLDYQEIADILGQTVSSVKSLLFRARGSVKIQLEPYFAEPLYTELEGMSSR
ncbi:RNA polymerase sigma-70 factor, ECF subfamily [Paenibacillus uliginis N3/975]|uniref:RNA polymerase sigma-70 factor, ECF subfamily n=2 Tax=Paenibacillus TaxID=44249 RepID=A0A1X7HIM5_9BACL|nr:RNA polymerase sigma-70 factor, ECF subfamily [Paenibacillus uliginis N3/975]